jgi:predicted component of type VI protein secretion system
MYESECNALALEIMQREKLGEDEDDAEALSLRLQDTIRQFVEEARKTEEDTPG